ncbi:S1 RNA-binding domain-containing protein [Alistipes finegoldii]
MEVLCLGKEYDGIVDRVESYGIFVRIGKASGLVFLGGRYTISEEHSNEVILSV